jgi:pilus assembly protein CpaC
LKLHAETTLTTRNGEPARLENGGQFPIPVPQSLGTVTIQWREFGVIMQSLPIIVSPTRLKQQVTIEVSERDLTTAVTLNGVSVPGINLRRVQTQAEMNFGDTLVVGGLIFTRFTDATAKIPFLGEVPGIGAAFRRQNYTEAETELLVMITPEFVAPLNCEEVPPGGPGLFTEPPTDREFYSQGLVEVPAWGGGRCAGGACPPGAMMPAGMPMPTSPEILPSPDNGPMMAPPNGPVEPTPSNPPGLITPPGVPAPPPPIPPTDPSLSRRNATRTRWPSTSSVQQVSAQRSSKAPSAVRQADYLDQLNANARRARATGNQYKSKPVSDPSRTPQ